MNSISTFSKADEQFEANKIRDIVSLEGGFKYLLVRCLSRTKDLKILMEKHGLSYQKGKSKLKENMKCVFDSSISIDELEAELRRNHEIARSEHEKLERQLLNELDKMESYNWGGLYQNALERTIVDYYVKKIDNIDELNRRINNELVASLRGYVQSSWYNNWTSIVIEEIFKSHNFKDNTFLIQMQVKRQLYLCFSNYTSILGILQWSLHGS